MQAEHRGEHDESCVADDQVNHVFGGDTKSAGVHQVPQHDEWYEDKFLRIPQRAADFAEDEFLCRDVGREKKFQRLAVSFAG